MKLKQYALPALIQGAALLISIGLMFIASLFELVALNPVPSVLSISFVVVCLDILALTFFGERPLSAFSAFKPNPIYRIPLVMVLAIVTLLSGFLIHNAHTKPIHHSRLLDSGEKYLMDLEYDKAIVAFEKAISISARDPQAMLGLAKAHIMSGNIEEGTRILQLLQSLYPEDEELFLQVWEMLETSNPVAAYDALMYYHDASDSRNLPAAVSNLYDEVAASPVLPTVSLDGGRYLKPVSVSFNTTALNKSHVVYYTLDGEIPTRRSSVYSGEVLVEETSMLQFATYSPKGISTEIQYFYFEIDDIMRARFEDLIERSDSAYENTQVGTEVGNCIAGAKEALAPVLEKAKEVLGRDVLPYDVAIEAYADLNNALYEFGLKIIVPTERAELQMAIEDARVVYEESVEGTEIGTFVEGSKQLLQSTIDESVLVYESLISRQDTIDNSVSELRSAIDAFLKMEIMSDNTQLNSAINEATTLYNNSVEGTRLGQYRSGSKSRLLNAINNAVVVVNDRTSPQDRVDSILADINTAIRDFRASVITQDDIILSNAGAQKGKVTVSLLWSSTDDLDLHVTSPRGDTVNYDNVYSSSGGRLDIDRQVNTFVSNPVENIYWDNPPSGTYTVKVNVFSKRSSGTISARVRVVVNGVATNYNVSISSGTKTVCTFRY